MENLVFKASQRIKFEEFIQYYNDYGDVDENFITPNGFMWKFSELKETEKDAEF